jgi:hypothetical protein
VVVRDLPRIELRAASFPLEFEQLQLESRSKMDFRHNAARRRRVMRDERLEVDRPVPTESAPQPFRRYQTSVVLSSQPTILDIVPKSVWLNGFCIVMAILIAMGLVLVPRLGTADNSIWGTVMSRAEWWSVEHSGSLGQLFLTALSVFNVGLCFQIYHLRRHRSDDYHGAYQIWRWALVPGIMVAVMGTAVPTEMLGYLLTASIPPQSTAMVTGLGLGLGGFLIAAMSARLYLEVRECRWATFLLGLTTILAILCLTLTWNRFAGLWESPAGSLLSPTNVWLMAVASAFGALLSYFGYVYRDVIGEVTSATPTVVDEDAESKQAEAPAAPLESSPAKVTDSTASPAKANRELSRESLESKLEPQVAEAGSEEILARRKRRRVA